MEPEETEREWPSAYGDDPQNSPIYVAEEPPTLAEKVRDKVSDLFKYSDRV